MTLTNNLCFLAISVAVLTANAGVVDAELPQLRERYQPLTWLGEGEPRDSDVTVITPLLEESVRPAGMARLADYIDANPDSPWAASLEGYYAAMQAQRSLYQSPEVF